MKHLLLAAALTGAALLTPVASADIDGAEARPFELLLKTAPLVAVGTVTDISAIRSVDAKAANDFSPAATPEVYTYYEFQPEYVLKGELPKRVQLRVRGGHTARAAVEPRVKFELGRPTLLLLSPDYGLDPQTGEPRQSFVVLYQSAYPLSDNAFQVVHDGKPKTWRIDDVIAQLDRIATLEQRRAERGEPAAAVAPTVAVGKPRPGLEPPPNEAGRDERPSPLLERVKPLQLESPRP